ncbi:ATP-binding protein, partial [Aeropyrum camini]|uniref:ATP-binding protein n=1 Tax=Aeropyrum camini TaxID=229980 RepID=UPI000787F056
EVRISRGGLEAASQVSRLILSRSRQSGSEYIVISSVYRGYSRVVVAVANDSPDELRVDFEVLSSIIASSVPGVQVAPLEAGEAGGLAREFSRLLGVRGSTPPLVAPASKPAAPPSPGGGSLLKIGVRLDTPTPEPLYLDRGDIEGHIGVFGSTGSGKTTTLSTIACGAADTGLPVVVADWHGEYRSILKGAGCRPRVIDPGREGGINPLSLDWDYSVKAALLSSALGLTEPQHYMLLKILEEREPRGLAELYSIIEALEENSRWDREVKRGLMRRLGPLASRAGRSLAEGEGPSLGGEGIYIVDTGSIRNVQLRKTYSILLAAYLQHKVLNRDIGPLMLVIDEAHNIFDGEESFPSVMMAESRKFGLYIALATQNPYLLPLRAVSNTNTKIIHSLRWWRDLESVASALSSPGRQQPGYPT